VTFPSGLRALNHPKFRLYFTGQVLSQVGTWMQSVAQSWLVLQLTGSPLRLGLISTLQFGPMLVFSLASGAVADRTPKRRLLLATQSILAGQALALASLVWSGHVRYWHVAVLACLLGLVNTLDNPARQSLVSELVAKSDVVNAVALSSAGFNSARIVGPAAAGLLIARFGIAPAFLLNGLSFLFVIVALLRLGAHDERRRPRGESMLVEMREGVAYALHTPRLRLALSVLLVVSVFVFNFGVYVPLLARNVLHQGAEGFGFLMAAVGLGAVAGALTVGAIRRAQPPPSLIFIAAVLACTGILVLAFVGRFGVALPVLFLVGFFAIVVTAGCNTTLQINAPDELRGRVMSLYSLVFGGSVPLGALLVGFISQHWGVRTAFIVMGTTGLCGTAAIVIGWQAGRRPR
jgi:predicted MFS family arabinose efflux permease